MKLKRYLLYICSITLALQSCGPGEPGVYKNNEIRSSKRSDFQQLNDQLFRALKANNVYQIENLMSKNLLAMGDYRQKIEQISTQSQSGSYTMLDEYYIINYKHTDTHKINTAATDGNKYTFYCSAITKEMYAGFLIPKSKGDKCIVTIVYCKYDYGWKLNTLDIQPYTITGKTAPQLYQTAVKQYNKGYIVDAFNTMLLVDKCMRPNELWGYPNDVEMGAFYGKVLNVVNNFRYPLIISQVPTKPKIFEVTHQTTDEGIFPAVHYISAINISDTAALKKENNLVVKVIGKMFPGIDRDKKYIFFSAFNKLPDSKTYTPSFDMAATLSSK